MQPNLDTKIKSYLTFKLGEEFFSIHVSKVENILEMMRITKVPNTPVYMSGVINLRENVLPVIDTRVKFNLPPKEQSKDTCIIVLNLEIKSKAIKLGAIVDSVQEVIDIEPHQIKDPPSIGEGVRSEFIYGMVNYKDQFIMLLDMDKIFSSQDIIELRQAGEDADVPADDSIE